MKSGEIWSFKCDPWGKCFIRVVLDLGTLEMEDDSPLDFVGESLLVQLAVKNEFDQDSVITNGMFLYHHRKPARVGLTKEGKCLVRQEDVEFPCWVEDLDGQIVFVRGEMARIVEAANARALHTEWDVTAVSFYPEHLPSIVSEMALPLEKRIGVGISSSDVRFHPKRAEILRTVGERLDRPYLKEVELRLGVARLASYLQALNR